MFHFFSVSRFSFNSISIFTTFIIAVLRVLSFLDLFVSIDFPAENRSQFAGVFFMLIIFYMMLDIVNIALLNAFIYSL